MLPDAAADPYDVGHDPRLADALVNSREIASITAIAQEVRTAIYGGEYAPGDQLPTRAQLAKVKGVSAESISVVMRMLASEGLVSLEQGRGTFVLPRQRYRVEVAVSRAGAVVPKPVFRAASGRLAAAVKDELAASGLEIGGIPGIAPPVLAAAVTIEAGGLAQAVALALGLTRSALAEDGSWDLAGASVEARPAD